MENGYCSCSTKSVRIPDISIVDEQSAHVCRSDACPKEAVEAWAATLRKEYPTILFRSASACLPAPAESVKGKGKERADDAWGLEAVLALFKQWVNEKKDDKPLTVAVVGVTNVRPLLTESA